MSHLVSHETCESDLVAALPGMVGGSRKAACARGQRAALPMLARRVSRKVHRQIVIGKLCSGFHKAGYL